MLANFVRYLILGQVVTVTILYLGGIVHTIHLLRFHMQEQSAAMTRVLWGLMFSLIGGLTSCIGIGAILIWHWEPALALWRVPLWTLGMLMFFFAWLCIFRVSFRADLHPTEALRRPPKDSR